MAMGTRKQREKQEDLWIAHTELAIGAGASVLSAVERVAGGRGLRRVCRGTGARSSMRREYGRPSLTPGIYFRALLIGYFEGIDGGARHRLAAGGFAGAAAVCGHWLDEYTPDHSTISRTRRLIDVDTHREVFAWVLGVLADRGLLKGQRIGHRRDDAGGECGDALDRAAGHRGELRGVSARAGEGSGIETPTREDLARLDRKRKKRTSNKEWKSPADEDARITKMKDGRTHLAHKAEHAVDLDTGAVVAVTLQARRQGRHDHAG